MTRRATRGSTAIPDWFGATYAHGTLRLDRPSRDGALPATSIALVDAVIASYERTGDDPPIERIHVGVSGPRGSARP